MDSADSSAAPTTSTEPGTVVVVGASRGLGLAASRSFLDAGWTVVATARTVTEGPLVELAGENPDRLRLLRHDILDDEDIAALRDEVARADVDVLYINAGITDADLPVGQVSTEVFTDVMVTNALAPMRLVERVGPAVVDGGMIAVVSSRQGSISFNTRGGHEVYRASKSALNQLMRSYAARSDRPNRTLLLLHPGWVRTELGGPEAMLTPEESAQGLVRVVAAQRHAEGLQFLDHTGAIVPW